MVIWLSPRDLNPYDTTRQTFPIEVVRESDSEFVGILVRPTFEGHERVVQLECHYPKFAWQKTVELI